MTQQSRICRTVRGKNSLTTTARPLVSVYQITVCHNIAYCKACLSPHPMEHEVTNTNPLLKRVCVCADRFPVFVSLCFS